MSDALRVRDLANTDERVTITVRPIVALLAQEVEASFVRHDSDERRTAWTGNEQVGPFLHRLTSSAHAAVSGDMCADSGTTRRAVVRCGAWGAFILAFLTEEDAS